MPARTLLFLLFLLSLAPQGLAQGIGDRLLADPQVQEGLAFIRANEPRVTERQIQLTEIPAPPFEEGERARAYKRMFEQRGLEQVRIDAEGNVIGVRPGSDDGPRLVSAPISIRSFLPRRM